jgi:hypothetical protein
MVVTVATGICLLAFGLWYARFEAATPIYPTRLAVVIGVGVTMVGQVIMALALYDYGPVAMIVAVCVPFALTGLPMYIVQDMKDFQFYDEGNLKKRDTGPLGKLDKGQDANAEEKAPSTHNLGR